jgi:hypothetical protein
MKKVILYLLVISGFVFCQNIKLAEDLYYSYENYREESLSHRRIKHSDIIPLIEQIKVNKDFTVTKVGESVEKRDIYLINWGEGKRKIFLWSQMHGDEPTATMALFDIFNFLSSENNFKEEKQKLREELTIYFMPMVNPDGAEQYQRRNVYEIDINRDALRLSTPEGRILMNTFDNLKADFGFNLHDQSSNLTAGQTFKTASISFLAPAFDKERSYNETRENAGKVISVMTRILNVFVPGHIGKYSDEFEPRAFGDVFQSKGTATILIESGGWKDDPERQFVRKLNFLAMISAFCSVADASYKSTELSIYENLPENERYLYDIILRNITIKENDKIYLSDLAFMINERQSDSERGFILNTVLSDKGDLSTFYGNEDFDFSGLTAEAGKLYPEEIKSEAELANLDVFQILTGGYTAARVGWKGSAEKNESLIEILEPDKEPRITNPFKQGSKPNFILKKDNEVYYAFINNRLIDVRKKTVIFSPDKK